MIVQMILNEVQGAVSEDVYFMALMNACRGNEIGIVRSMIAEIEKQPGWIGTILNKVDKNGVSCLMAACETGRIAAIAELMRCLTKEMAKVDRRADGLDVLQLRNFAVTNRVCYVCVCMYVYMCACTCVCMYLYMYAGVSVCRVQLLLLDTYGLTHQYDRIRTCTHSFFTRSFIFTNVNY